MDDAVATFEQNSLTGHQPMTSLGIKGRIACIHNDLWPTLALTISKFGSSCLPKVGDNNGIPRISGYLNPSHPVESKAFLVGGDSISSLMDDEYVQKNVH